MAQPAYSRSGSRTTTNSNDMLFNVANASRMLAAASGSPSAGYSASITVGVTLATPPAAAPAIGAGGIANALSGTAGLTPRSWISIYGTNLATAARVVTTGDLTNSTLPTSLAGVSVQVNGKAAFIQYVSPTQINVLAPEDTSTGQVAETVTNSAGTSNTMTALMQPVLPGLAVKSGYVRAVRYPDGAIINGTGADEPGFLTSAAVGQNEIISLFGTGFGPAQSAPAAGSVFTGAYQSVNPVTVRIGGVQAEVLWAGLVASGLNQINLRVPATLGDGDHAVVATVAGMDTQANALLKVSAAAKLPTTSPTAGLIVRPSPMELAAFPFAPVTRGRRASIEEITFLAALIPEAGEMGACQALPGMIQLA